MRNSPIFGTTALVFALVATLAAPLRADDSQPAGGGRIAVSIKQNDATGSGSFEVHRPADPSSGAAGELVASGRSGLPVRVPTGRYDVVVRLDGTIDRPEHWIRGVKVENGRTVQLEQTFQTSILEVRVTANGRRAAATIYVRRAGETAQVATLGAGVRAVISSGRYDIVVRHRTAERTFTAVELLPGRARTLNATF